MDFAYTNSTTHHFLSLVFLDDEWWGKLD